MRECFEILFQNSSGLVAVSVFVKDQMGFSGYRGNTLEACILFRNVWEFISSYSYVRWLFSGIYFGFWISIEWVDMNLNFFQFFLRKKVGYKVCFYIQTLRARKIPYNKTIMIDRDSSIVDGIGHIFWIFLELIKILYLTWITGALEYTEIASIQTRIYPDYFLLGLLQAFANLWMSPNGRNVLCLRKVVPTYFHLKSKECGQLHFASLNIGYRWGWKIWGEFQFLTVRLKDENDSIK